MSQQPLLNIQQVSKRFGQVQALSSVSLTLVAGRVYGLAGENGAGKSTLVRVLCGVHAEHEGRIELDGKTYLPRSPADAQRAGISVFHQEIPICPNLSVAANIFLGSNFPGRKWFPDWKRLEVQCDELFGQLLGIHFNSRRLMRECTVAERQLALLVRVLSQNARLVILDEPTTALTPSEVANLFAIIRRLKSQGITFLFVSHLLDELLELSDEIYVLRDGTVAGHLERSKFEVRTLTRLIAGRLLEETPGRPSPLQTAPRLEACGLFRAGEFRDISFEVTPGEILGITGLQGSGRSAVARALFGAPPADTGEIRLDGIRVVLNTPQDAIRVGIGYVPEERQTLGLFDDLDVQSNIGISRLDALTRYGLLPGNALRELALEMQSKLRIKFSAGDAPIGSLSGGNQQKALIARSLAVAPKVLVMNEPTRGVDVGAKDEICRLLQALAATGCSLIIASSDIDEIIRLSDRILVMNRGHVSAEFSRAEATKEAVIHAAGVAVQDPVAL